MFMVFQSQIIVIMYVHKLHLKRILQPLLGFAATQKSKTHPKKGAKAEALKRSDLKSWNRSSKRRKGGRLFGSTLHPGDPVARWRLHPRWRVDPIHAGSRLYRLGGEMLHIWDYSDYIQPLEGFFPTKQYNLMAKRSGDEHAHSVVNCWRILTEMWKEHRNAGNLNMWTDQWFRMLFRENASRVSEKMTSRIQLWRGVRQDSK